MTSGLSDRGAAGSLEESVGCGGLRGASRRASVRRKGGGAGGGAGGSPGPRKGKSGVGVTRVEGPGEGWASTRAAGKESGRGGGPPCAEEGGFPGLRGAEGTSGEGRVGERRLGQMFDVGVYEV